MPSESAPASEGQGESTSASDAQGAPAEGASESASGESAPDAPEAAADGEPAVEEIPEDAAGGETAAADEGAAKKPGKSSGDHDDESGRSASNAAGPADAGDTDEEGGQPERAPEKTPQEILAEMGVVRVEEADLPKAAPQQEPTEQQVEPAEERDGEVTEAAEGEAAQAAEGATETEKTETEENGAEAGDGEAADAALAAREGEDASGDSGLITERKEQDENEVRTNFSDLDNKDTTSTLETVEEHYDLFVDENGVYQLTFIIQEGTDSEDITIDLTKALDALQAYAGATGANTLQPGDTRAFQIWITSESGHTYKYKDGSFILTTPESDPDDIPENPAQGFDGQDLDNEHTGPATRDAYTNLPAL